MAQSGSATFASPDDYRAAIGVARVNLVVTEGGNFSARLTWLNLGHLYVLRGYENLPRISFMALSATQVFVSFPTRQYSALTYGSTNLKLGDFVLHSCGERNHQRTSGKAQWGLISLPPEQLAACAQALTGLRITSPSEGMILRPSRSTGTRLLQLHSKACHLAETKSEIIANPEVSRALQQELLHALVNCLTAEDGSDHPRQRQRHADVMASFEDALDTHDHPHLNVRRLCTAIGVPERTLRLCCTEFLGMSPTRYYLLRRLNSARSALCRSKPETASVAQIARDHQFLEPGRFAVAYRAVFGEMPSATLQRPRTKET